MLSYRGRSENELRERLIRKGFSEDAVHMTLSYLKDAGFIDDASLAEDLKRQVLGQKMLGYCAARSYMYKRGLTRELVESTLGYDEEVEFSNARNLMEKKLKSAGNFPAAKEKKKFYDYLRRKGFSPFVISKVLRDYESGEIEEG